MNATDDIPWITTHTENDVDLIDPAPDQITLLDLAKGLEQRRYSGQADWTIWQHSFIVAALVDARGEASSHDTLPNCIFRLAGLLHDAHEAYLGDTPTPVARAIKLRMGTAAQDAFTTAARQLETDIDMAILGHLEAEFGVDLSAIFHPDVQAVVKTADLDALILERNYFFPDSDSRRSWGSDVEVHAAAMQARGSEDPSFVEHISVAEAMLALLAEGDESSVLWTMNVLRQIAMYR